MQGVGQVIGEHIAYERDTGQLLSGSFMDYFMPRAEHAAPTTLIDCGVPSPANVLGAKGAGEAGATGSVPALANAVLNALKPLGVRKIDMPYTSDRLWRAIHEAKHNARSRRRSDAGLSAPATPLMSQHLKAMPGGAAGPAA